MRDILDKYKRLLNEAKELSGETEMEEFAEKEVLVLKRLVIVLRRREDFLF